MKQTKTPTQRKVSFLKQVRIMRAQIAYLRESNSAISHDVANKLESILEGTQGIRWTPQEKGRQESSFIIALHKVNTEDLKARIEKAQEDEHSNDTPRTGTELAYKVAAGRRHHSVDAE